MASALIEHEKHRNYPIRRRSIRKFFSWFSIVYNRRFDRKSAFSTMIKMKNYPKQFSELFVNVSRQLTFLSLSSADRPLYLLAVDMKIAKQKMKNDRSLIAYQDYLLQLALDWDCINTAKEWIVQDSLDNIYDKKGIFCRALTKQRHRFVHYFIQLGLEIDEVFFDRKVNPFAARNYNQNNKRYSEFIRILYTEEWIVCRFHSHGMSFVLLRFRIEKIGYYVKL